MSDVGWLDELHLEPGPPWLTMGTRALQPEAWLVEDDDLRDDLALKQELLRARHDEVFAAVRSRAVQAASEEVLEMVSITTGRSAEPGLHPLDAAGRLVQEDLCLLVEHDDGFRLDAASLCFPSYWRLSDKLGRPLPAVHEPVAHYDTELASRVDRLVSRLNPDRPVWRRNWSIHDDPTYFLPEPTERPPLGEPPAGLWLRSERQTLRRLPRSGAILFTIRTQQLPLSALARSPKVAHRMADAITSWSDQLRAYKGGHGALAAVPWLRSL